MFQTTGSRETPQSVGFNRNYQFRYPDPYNNDNISIFDALASLDKNQNMFMNPAMEVDQAFVGGTQTSFINGYICDGILSGGNGSPTVRYTAQQVTDAPPGYFNSAKVSVTTAQASFSSTQSAYLYMPIEGYIFRKLTTNGSGSSPFVIGFWVKANRPGQYTAMLTGASGGEYFYPFVITASNVWQYISFVVPASTGTSFNTTNTSGLTLFICLAAGSGQIQAGGFQWVSSGAPACTGQINGVAATTDTFQITGIMCFPGNIPVPQARAPYLMPRFTDALEFCQRYYEKSYDLTIKPGSTNQSPGSDGWFLNWTTSNASPFLIFEVFFKVKKRTAPTMTSYSDSSGTAGKGRDVTNGNVDCVATWFNQGESGATLELDSTAAGASFNTVAQWTADARM